MPVRKHRAPKGALRLESCGTYNRVTNVRKHRAPNGALRPEIIKARQDGQLNNARKHRAPNGALRQEVVNLLQNALSGSESTERHKVH